MRRMVEKILRCYGRDILLARGEEKIMVTGFLQPVTGRGQNMSDILVHPLRTQGKAQYVYIGPVEPEVQAQDELTLDGRTYILRRVDQISDMNGPAYRWGMCVEKGAEDTWGSTL